MSRTGLEDAYIMRGSKKLRMGYTTGSCAAAAARGAAFMLLSGKEIQEVKIHTPKGIVLNLELLDIRIWRSRRPVLQRNRRYVLCERTPGMIRM